MNLVHRNLRCMNAWEMLTNRPDWSDLFREIARALEVFSFTESSEFRNACFNPPAPITALRSTLTTRSLLRVLIT